MGREAQDGHLDFHTVPITLKIPYDQNMVKIVVCFLQPSSKQSKDGETTDRAHSKNKGEHNFTDFID